MPDDIKTAFVRSFIFPIIAAVVIVAAFKTWRPEKFEQVHKPVRVEEEETLPVFGQVPPFSLTRADGKAITNADLEGKIWIADFIFTRCSGICPLMTGKMGLLAEEFAKESNLFFVSFSVDPEHDTPAILGEYAKRFKTDPARWFFLTGDKAQIYRLSNQHFHLGVEEISPAEREAVDQSVRHSSKFVLVDPKGQIRGYYDSDEKNEGAKIIADARLLLSGRE